MKYALTTLAVIVSGCAAGNTAVRSDDYAQRPVFETKTSAGVQRLSSQEEALQGLREQGAVIDDMIRCALVSRDNFRQEFNEIEQKGHAEYAALEKLLSARGETVFEWHKSNQYRQFATVEMDKDGNPLPVNSRNPARIYAYTKVNSLEAYGGARDVFCVQSSAPLDLTVTGTYDNLADAILAVKRAHAADDERVDREMQERGKAAEEMFKRQGKAARQRFEEMRKQSEEILKHYRQGSQEGVETYRSEHEQQRKEWYEQQGAPATPQPVTPQNPSKVNPQQEKKQPEALPSIKPESGAELKGGYKQIRGEIRRQFESDRDEMHRRYEEDSDHIRKDFERDRDEIRLRYEEERKKILGE